MEHFILFVQLIIMITIIAYEYRFDISNYKIKNLFDLATKLNKTQIFKKAQNYFALKVDWALEILFSKMRASLK